MENNFKHEFNVQIKPLTDVAGTLSAEDVKDTLFTGELMSFLKKCDDNIFDLVITSPPYNKGEIMVTKNQPLVYDNYKDDVEESEYQRQQVEMLDEIYRTVKPGGSFFYNHKLRFQKTNSIDPALWLAKSKWHIRERITWDRKQAGYFGGARFWHTNEDIWWLYKPLENGEKAKHLGTRHAILGSVWNISPDSYAKREIAKKIEFAGLDFSKYSNHPAMFPLELPLRIIYSITDGEKNKLIFDPYSGSGTTALAAKLLGEYCCGLDISPTYNEMAQARINNVSDRDRARVEKELALHVVGKSYKKRQTDNLELDDDKSVVEAIEEITEEENND